MIEEMDWEEFLLADAIAGVSGSSAIGPCSLMGNGGSRQGLQKNSKVLKQVLVAEELG